MRICGVSPKYKIGDLIKLNEFGRLVIDNNKERVGLVISAPSNMLYPLTASPDEESFCFWAYDIMLGGELITGVPQEFMIFYFEQEDL